MNPPTPKEQLNQAIRNLETVNKTNLPNIYFVGKCGSGKSFSAEYMIKKYDYQVAKFAYPVYMIAEKYFNMSDKDRKLLQTIGTEAGRYTIDNDIWINRFREDMTIVNKTAQLLNKPLNKFVMDDCRFPNEHQTLKALGFVGIYLDVSDDIRKKRLMDRDGKTQEETFNHPSETLIDTFKDELIKVDYSQDLYTSYKNLTEVSKRLVL